MLSTVGWVAVWIGVGCAGGGSTAGKGGAEGPAASDTAQDAQGDADDQGDSAAGGDAAADGDGGVTPPDSGVDDAGGTDTAATDPFLTGRCPAGMVGVPTAEPVFCIDRYEVVAEGGVATSRPGVVPRGAVSFLGARALCAATPVLDASGLEVGRKRLARSAEWEDANDGVLGPGGSRQPYGDTWEDRRCAAPDTDGTVWLFDAQATGSLPGCVSDFGVYDGVGNLWEWMDPEVDTHTAAAFDRFAADGLRLWVEDDTGISVLEGDALRLRVQVITAPSAVTVVDGRLFVPSGPLSGDLRGYLMRDGEPPALGWAAVRLAPGDGGYWVQVDADADGLPIPDKRGCAWYVGFPVGGGCDIQSPSYFHTAVFEGSISFRCASDPLP